MTPSERKATTVLWMDLTEASAKIRAEENHDDGDEAWPAWGGVIPLSVVAGQPEPDPLVADGTPAPGFRLPGVGRGEGSQG
jgi:hypothetical protein